MTGIFFTSAQNEPASVPIKPLHYNYTLCISVKHELASRVRAISREIKIGEPQCDFQSKI